MQTEKWEFVRVSDLIKSGKLLINDGYRVTNRELGPSGIPFVRGGDIGGGGYISSEVEDHVQPKFYDRLTAKLTQAGDVAFISKGTVGRVGFLRPHQPAVVFAPQVCYWRSLQTSSLHPRFLFYLLNGSEFQSNLNAVKTHGSMTADYVSLTDQRSFKLTIPPIESQVATAEMLGALDDKIDLNRRMNETLEAIARAIFQSWFVDFDPVRAKMEGRPPHGMDAETADLFPNRFEDVQGCQIPQGWTTSPILQLGELISGGTPATANPDYWDGNISWASAKDVSQCKDAFLIATERSITSLGLENSATKVIPALASVIVARGATTGRFVMFGRSIAMNQTCYALRSREGVSFYLYCLLHEVIGNLVHAAHGSVFDTITTATFERAFVLNPPTSLKGRFEEQAKPLFRRILANIEETQTLAALRDALLPKLLSGEIRVKEAEIILEAAT